MTAKKITEKAFGLEMEGIEVRMTREEAREVLKMVSQGFSHPPMIGNNTDYDAKRIGGEFTRTVEEALKR